MTLETLKTELKNKNNVNGPIIFKCEDSDFIAHQYIREILSIYDEYDPTVEHDIRVLDDLSNLKYNFFPVLSSYLFVYNTDTFDTDIDITKFETLFIICKKISKSLEKSVGDLVIDIPKLENWQVEDWIKYRCPTVYQDLSDLPYLCNNNLYCIDNEVNKLSIFSPNGHSIQTADASSKQITKFVLKSLRSDESWNYLCNNDYTFDLIKGVLTNNFSVVKYILTRNIELNAAVFYQVLYSTAELMARILPDNTATPDSLGITKGKYWAIKYTYGAFWDKVRLESLLRFLSELDYYIKSGVVNMDSDLLNYIIIKILGGTI